MQKRMIKLRALCSGTLLTGASTGIFSNSIAVFISPVCSDLGLSRGSFTLISLITLLSSMAALPLFGKLLPKTDLRRMILFCSFICVSCVMVYSFCFKVWQFYIAAALYGLFVNGITLLTVGMMLRQLGFKVDGLASGSAFAGAGMLSFIFLPLLQRVVAAYSWRWGYRLQAVAGALVLLAALLIMPKPNPQTNAARRTASFLPLLKQRSTLFAAAALFIANAVNLALFNHSSANLTGLGLSAAAAASVTSWAALLSSVSKPLFGLSIDKFGLKKGSLILSLGLLSASAAALALPFSSVALFAFPVFLSAAACCNSIPANIFAAKLFDDDHFSAAVSLLTLASTAGSAIGPPIAGAVFDSFGSYTYMWYFCGASAIAVGFLLICAINCSGLLK